MSFIQRNLADSILNKIETDDHIYIDVDIPYDPASLSTEESTPASYRATKTEPILKNPSDYHLTVDRFSIPGFLIPSYIFDPANPGTVRLDYLGSSSTQQLVYVPNNQLQPWEEGYYYLYDFQHWAEMVNTALAAAHAALATAPVGSLPPYIVWDTDAQKFKVYAQKQYYDMAVGHIEVYFDTPLYSHLPFLPWATSLVQPYWQLLFKDYRNNTESIGGVDYLFLKQQAVGVSYWQPAKSLIFISNTIPVKNTYTEINNVRPDNSNSNSLGILIDFKIDALSSLDQRKTLIYVPQQNYRRLDLYGQTPLKTIDISVYWSDITGALHPLRIPSFDAVNIKLLFIKKELSE